MLLIILVLLFILSKYIKKYNLFSKKEYILLSLFSIVSAYSLLINIFMIYQKTFIDTLKEINYKFWFFFLTIFIIFSFYIGIKILIKKNNKVKIEKEKRKYNAEDWQKIIFLTIFILFIFLNFAVHKYIMKNFGDVSAEEVIFNIISPKKGMGEDQRVILLFGPILNTILPFISSIILLNFNFKVYYKDKLRINRNKYLNFLILIVTIFWSFSFYQMGKAIKLPDILKQTVLSSNFIQENYVNPNDVEIVQTTAKKRNLIHIYLESMETSYTSFANGGVMDDDMIKELVQLAKNNVTVRDSYTDGLIGATQTAGGGWTIAGHVNVEAGIPLKVPIGGNNYGQNGTFLPGVITIGDILEKLGYNQEFIAGSNTQFAGSNVFFTTHGNYEIKDINYYYQTKELPEGYYVNWGFEDEKVFQFTKDALVQLASEDKPFNLTLRTADTHYPDGYVTEKTPKKYKTSYENAISFSSTQIVEFIKWIQKQPFYENTTIVINGDHLTMNKEILKDVPEIQRKIYFTIINPANKFDKKRLYDRYYTLYDLFPTILEALGYDIKGDRLGLGVSLFSDQETLLEQYNLNVLDQHLKQASSFYNKFLNVNNQSEYNLKKYKGN